MMGAAYIRPQLAKTPTKTSIRPAEAMASEDWVVERKWDGMRALFHILPGETLIFSRTGQDLREQFPEFANLHTHFEHPAILDGEIVAMDPDREDTESLELLQMRAGDKKARRLDQIPVSVVFFDVLAARLGESHTPFSGDAHPLSERLEVLRLLLVDTPFRMPELLEEGDSIPDHWEGVLVKNYHSPYRPGKRTSEWLKYKATNRATLYCYDLTPGEGKRAGSFGALKVRDANAVHRGLVGSGFTDGQIAEILELHHLGEEFLVEVEYRFLSKTGLMVNTAYKGLRTDKKEADVL